VCGVARTSALMSSQRSPKLAAMTQGSLAAVKVSAAQGLPGYSSGTILGRVSKAGRSGVGARGNILILAINGGQLNPSRQGWHYQCDMWCRPNKAGHGCCGDHALCDSISNAHRSLPGNDTGDDPTTDSKHVANTLALTLTLTQCGCSAH
jgi:hypothetical protein